MSHIKQITVFGGSGFIGRHMIRLLARTGATIRIPTRDPEKALLLKPMGDTGQIVPIACRSDSDQSMEKAIGRSDTVINLIGILFQKNSSGFRAAHVEKAASIARMAKAAGAERLIHMSSLGVSKQSDSLYARSKAEGEQAVRAAFPAATLLRPSIVFGPEDDFFNRFSGMARFLPFLPLIGGGHSRFQPVYVGDIAEAVMKILTTPPLNGGTYELAGPQVYSFKELMQIMLNVTGQKRCLLPMPWSLATLNAAFMELLPTPPLTRDQIKLLRTDNILTDKNAATLQTLGITPTALEIILPTYLQRFRMNAPQPLAAH